MHDTAYEIGRLVMNTYCDLATAKILEIGSLDVNGSLRDHAAPSTKYIGLDFQKGAGVDTVIRPGLPLPVDNEAFDLVMASSVFEHDQAFWLTFLEMCRKARKGGFVYINAPANGWVHRYPQDNWRFYPDSGKALAKWANSQGIRVKLVESFVSDQQADGWNDFVAIFRIGTRATSLPDTPVSNQIACSNVVNWTSQEIIRPQVVPQDRRSADEATATAGSLYEQLAAKDAELDRERTQRTIEQQTADLKVDSLKRRLTDLYVKLSQTQADVFVAKADNERQTVEAQSAGTEMGHQLEQLSSELADLRSAAAKFESENATLHSERDTLLSQLHEAENKAAHLSSEAIKSQSDRSHLESTLAQRVEEIEQTRRELENAITSLEANKTECEEACRRADELNEWVFQLADERRDAQAELEKAAAAAYLAEIDREEARQSMAVALKKADEAEHRYKESEALRVASGSQVEMFKGALAAIKASTSTRLQELEDQLAEIKHERAVLSDRVAAAGVLEMEMADQLEWVRCATEIISEEPRWWHALPRQARKKRRSERLRAAGLFDAEAYLERHPDVANEGMDPFEHYMLHGMKERRSR